MAEDMYEDDILPIDISKLGSEPVYSMKHTNMIEYSYDEGENDIGRGIIDDIISQGNRFALSYFKSILLGRGGLNSSIRYTYNTKEYILRMHHNPVSYRYTTDNHKFRKEIEIYRRLNTPPNSYFAKLLYAITIGSDETKNHPLYGSIFIFEYIPGKLLSSILGLSITTPLAIGRGLGKLVRSEMTEEDTDYIRSNVVDIYKHLLKACAIMKSYKITHRDITPFNIFVPTGELPYLFDFDAACFSEDKTVIADPNKIGYESCKTEVFKGTTIMATPRAKLRFPMRGSVDFEELYTYGIWSDIYAVIYIFYEYIYPILRDRKTKIQLLELLFHNVGNVATQNDFENNPRNANNSPYMPVIASVTQASSAAAALNEETVLSSVKNTEKDIENAKRPIERRKLVNSLRDKELALLKALRDADKRNFNSLNAKKQYKEGISKASAPAIRTDTDELEAIDKNYKRVADLTSYMQIIKSIASELKKVKMSGGKSMRRRQKKRRHSTRKI